MKEFQLPKWVRHERVTRTSDPVQIVSQTLTLGRRGRVGAIGPYLSISITTIWDTRAQVLIRPFKFRGKTYAIELHEYRSKWHPLYWVWRACEEQFRILEEIHDTGMRAFEEEQFRLMPESAEAAAWDAEHGDAYAEYLRNNYGA